MAGPAPACPGFPAGAAPAPRGPAGTPHRPPPPRPGPPTPGRRGGAATPPPPPPPPAPRVVAGRRASLVRGVGSSRRAARLARLGRTTAPADRDWSDP